MPEGHYDLARLESEVRRTCKQLPLRGRPAFFPLPLAYSVLFSLSLSLSLSLHVSCPQRETPVQRQRSRGSAQPRCLTPPPAPRAQINAGIARVPLDFPPGAPPDAPPVQLSAVNDPDDPASLPPGWDRIIYDPSALGEAARAPPEGCARPRPTRSAVLPTRIKSSTELRPHFRFPSTTQHIFGLAQPNTFSALHNTAFTFRRV